MTLHRARLRYDQNTEQGFHDWLSVWLTNMEPWAAQPNEVPPLVDPPDAGIPQHYAADLIFEWTEDRSHILDNLDGYLSSYADWYRIGYHVCDHDDPEQEGCSWDVQPRSGGAVPGWVPEMSP